MFKLKQLLSKISWKTFKNFFDLKTSTQWVVPIIFSLFLTIKKIMDIFQFFILVVKEIWADLSVGIFNSWDVRISECAVDESKHQGGFPNASCSEYHHPIVIALLGHYVRIYSAAPLTSFDVPLQD